MITPIGPLTNLETNREVEYMTAKEESEENVIYVGNKPPMSYVLAVVTQFNSGSSEVIIKARGRAISRAVDAAEITRNRFASDAKVKEIRIGTEAITNEEGRTSNVSSIEIVLAK
ncbi:DNA/RNA-binding protein Alba 2 [uncultured archaeon]|jgi:archaea-specific DNA-binding protein|nr:DNA/RNA-binding protein Alba 2 [uncultured archaeon]